MNPLNETMKIIIQRMGARYDAKAERVVDSDGTPLFTLEALAEQGWQGLRTRDPTLGERIGRAMLPLVGDTVEFFARYAHDPRREGQVIWWPGMPRTEPRYDMSRNELNKWMACRAAAKSRQPRIVVEHTTPRGRVEYYSPFVANTRIVRAAVQ